MKNVSTNLKKSGLRDESVSTAILSGKCFCHLKLSSLIADFTQVGAISLQFRRVSPTKPAKTEVPSSFPQCFSRTV